MSGYVGIDIGGTFIKATADGKFVKFPTPHSPFLASSLARAIAELCPDAKGAGIACPGAVKDGRAEFLPNLKEIEPLDGKELTAKLGLPVVLVNDGDAAAFYESMRIGAKNAVMIVLGTGVGGGIVIDGKPYVGMGGAGEIGHMVICVGGKRCSCGMSGCLEAYASASSLVSNAGNKFSSPEEVFAAADVDAAARKAVDEYVGYLCVGIIDLCNIFRPEAIIIGGGISNAKGLVPRIIDECRKLNYGYRFAPEPSIIKARFGDYAGALGAAELAKIRIEEKK